jgi:aminomuconate-semialdehyde/2-hydroxymuconate-6-semialdehyde dehydrogenase
VRAFPGWSRTPTAERSRILLALADRIDANLDRLAQAESVDNGKPLRLAKAVDIPRASANFRFFATAVLHTHSEAFRTDGVAFNYTLRQPRGVVGIISPWNLLTRSPGRSPAAATGNTAVASRRATPMTLIC